jgi:hypothetical protein
VKRVPKKWWQWVLVGLVLLLNMEAVLLWSKWPFTQERLTVSLERATGSRLQAARFRMTFFPSPGSVLDDATFERDGAQAPLARMRQLSVRGSWASVLTLQHHLAEMQPEDLHVSIPEKVPPAMRLHPPGKHETEVGEVVADGAVLEVRGMTFRFRRLRLHDLSRHSAIRIEVEVASPHPPGTVQAAALFGPWKGGASPLSGSFTLRGADLSRYEALEGILTGSGKFQGTLAAMSVKGQADVARFRVRRKGPATAVLAEYAATVSATTGETRLEQGDVQFLRTRLAVSGLIGKTTTLDFDGRQSHVQDLIRVFASSDEPGIRGPMSFRARVVLPAGEAPFLRRVLLDGSFGIKDAQFKPRTQDKMEKLSSRARGQDDDAPPADIDSDLQGHVRMRDGVARFDRVRLRVPGAVANGGGTFNVITKRVDLRGTVTTQATLSEAAGGGIKSFLLKPLNVFFRDRKNNAGAVLPVSIVGTYPHAKAQVSLTGKR